MRCGSMRFDLDDFGGGTHPSALLAFAWVARCHRRLGRLRRAPILGISHAKGPTTRRNGLASAVMEPMYVSKRPEALIAFATMVQ